MKKEFKAIDFFCGGGGMTCGFIKAGVEVLAGIDNDISCKSTYEYNNRSKFIHADISLLTPEDLAKKVSIKIRDDHMIFIGCSPCQYWSIINTSKAKSSQSKNLALSFIELVLYFLPGFVVIENVPGIAKKADSPLQEVILKLEKAGYTVETAIIKTADYGVPQKRKRFLLIASRIANTELVSIRRVEEPVTVRDFIGEGNGFEKIPAGHIDVTERMHSASRLSEHNQARIKLTQESGGNRFSWSKIQKLQIETYKNKDHSFKDVYGRMSWDEPAPTITTRFNSLSNGRFGHPDEERALSIREGATLQTFPPEYTFKTLSIGVAARMIGNAVPPLFAQRIAEHLINLEG